MELMEHFRILAQREFLKKCEFTNAWNARKVLGYSIQKKNIVVNLYNGQTKKLNKLPFSIDYYDKCHREFDGYHIKHPSYSRSIVKEVFMIELHNGEEEITIETIHENLVDFVKKQYDALEFIHNRTIRIGDNQSFSFQGHHRGFSTWKKKKKFENMRSYKNQKDVIHVQAREC